MDASYERQPQRYEQRRGENPRLHSHGRPQQHPRPLVQQQQQQSRGRPRRKPPSIHTNATGTQYYPVDEERSPRVVTPQQYYRGEQQLLAHQQQRHRRPVSGHTNTSSTTGSRSSLQHAPSFYSEISTASSSFPMRRGPNVGVVRKEHDPAVYIDRAHTESTQGMTSCSGDDTRETLSTPFESIDQHSSPPQRYPEEQTVRVFVGQQQHRQQQRPYLHSRWMLTYASPILKQSLAHTNSITFPHANPVEWEQLVAFIEPATKRNLTTSNVPQLLPWFHELDLRALLVECDAFLLPYCNEVQQPLDALRLCAIGLRVGRLRRTRHAAHAVAASLLSEGMGEWEIALLVTVSKLLLQSLSDAPPEGEDSEEEDEDEDDSQGSGGRTTASQVLRSIKAKNWFETSAAAELFIAYLRYLPGDCIVDQLWATNHSQISRFLQNPVVPYLVRQGMEEKQSKQNSGMWPIFSNDGKGEREQSSAWLERVWKYLNRPPLGPVETSPPPSPQRNISVRPPQRSISARPQQRPLPSSSAPPPTQHRPARTFAC